MRKIIKKAFQAAWPGGYASTFTQIIDITQLSITVTALIKIEVPHVISRGLKI